MEGEAFAKGQPETLGELFQGWEGPGETVLWEGGPWWTWMSKTWTP